MADHALTIRILTVFVFIVTVLLLFRHYQKGRRTDNFSQQNNPYSTQYSSDLYPTGASPGVSMPPAAAPYDQGAPFYNNTVSVPTYEVPSIQQMQSIEGNVGPIKGSDPVSDEVFRSVDYEVKPPPANLGCFPKDKLTAQDLLPKDAANSTWSKVMPSGQGDVSNQNFLTAGYQVGMSSTVLRNPNYSLRSEPPNPQVVVSPWLNSTIDPDLLRRPLELQSAPVC